MSNFVTRSCSSRYLSLRLQTTMRFFIALTIISSASAFAPTAKHDWGSSLQSALSDHDVEAKTVQSFSLPLADTEVAVPDVDTDSPVDRINARMTEIHRQMEIKDLTSVELKTTDLEIVHQDDDIVVVNKPSGILSVPGKGKSENPSLNEVVFDAIGCEMGRMDMMVVHRLGMDTSGLMVLAKTMDGLRGMNTAFRTRDVSRKYEALLVGHVKHDSGYIDLPLMRDYENPPYQRVSTDAHQRHLIDLTAQDVHKKLLEMPKESITKYEVISREALNGHPVTRVTLTSVSGRTHQLNVHCAAFGHPIVGDTTYGLGGDALPNGGLTTEEQQELAFNTERASAELQEQVAEAAAGMTMCVHAKSIGFDHPVTKKPVSYSSAAPF